MTTLVEVHHALDASLDTVGGLRHTPFPPTQFHQLCAYPVLERWDPIAMGRGGLKTYAFNVIVLVTKSVRHEDGYQALLEFADSEEAASIELALWDGNNTGADGETSAGAYRGASPMDVYVDGFRVLGVVAVGTSEAFGGQFELKVTTRSN